MRDDEAREGSSRSDATARPSRTFVTGLDLTTMTGTWRLSTSTTASVHELMNAVSRVVAESIPMIEMVRRTNEQLVAILQDSLPSFQAQQQAFIAQLLAALPQADVRAQLASAAAALAELHANPPVLSSDVLDVLSQLSAVTARIETVAPAAPETEIVEQDSVVLVKVRAEAASDDVAESDQRALVALPSWQIKWIWTMLFFLPFVVADSRDPTQEWLGTATGQAAAVLWATAMWEYRGKFHEVLGERQEPIE